MLIIFLTSITSVVAQPNRQMKIKQNLMLEKLNLTEDQQEKFDQLHYAHQEKAIETRSEIAKNRLEIRKLMDSDEIDQSKLMQLTKLNNTLRNEIQESRVQMWLSIYNALDDTQKEIWKDSRTGFGRMGMRMENVGPRGDFSGEGPGIGRKSKHWNMPGRRGINPNCWWN